MEDDKYSQIIEDNIRSHFERNGVLDEMRSGLHVNVLKVMRGEMDLKNDGPLCGGDIKQRGLLQLLNYLVVDYFNWYGYKHTLETFALETGDKYQLKPREKLQLEFGDRFNQKELPILLQMVMKQTKKVDANMLQKDANEQNAKKPLGVPGKLLKAGVVVKDIPPEGKPSKSQTLPAHKIKETPSEQQPSKTFQPSASSSFKRDTIRPQMKVNVRQALAGSKQETKSSSGRSTMVKRSFDVESSSKSTTGSSSPEDDGTSIDSDAFEDIPNRYYYREQEPPERSYPQGCGEEGPYEGSTAQARQRNQANLQRIVKRKPLRIFEMRNEDDKDKPHCSSRNTARPTPAKDNKPKTLEPTTTKRAKCLFQSQKRVNTSDHELDLRVRKPNCPPTMVSNIQGSTDDSDEDSDEYL